MKPAKVAVSSSVASWQQNNTAASSQIPLPLRRGPGRSERGQDQDGVDATSFGYRSSSSSRRNPEKSSVKSSILGASSFCCASAQKEDVLEGKTIVPPTKKKLLKGSTSKKSQSEANVSTPKPRIVSDPSDAKGATVLVSETIRKVPGVDLTSDKSFRQVNNNSVKASEKGKAPAGRNLQPDGETEGQKYTEVIRKLRKDPNHYTPNNLTSSNVESNKLYAKVENVGKTGNPNPIEVCPPKLRIEDAEDKRENAPEEDGRENAKEEDIRQRSVTDVMSRSGDTDDLDCPCCHTDREEEINSLDSEPNCSQSNDSPSLMLNPEQLVDSKESCIQGRDFEQEIRILESELQKERLNGKTQQQFIVEFKLELIAQLEQMKLELEKERHLRKEAEELAAKLRNDGNQRIPKSVEKCLEKVCENETDSSSVGICYQCRTVNFESYIKKLEEENCMFANELKKLRELTPCVESDQSTLLLAKVSQLEIDNRQQKLEYESCLDEVANKLVHTLLVQKNIEEDCKILQARLEELEIENARLMNGISHQEITRVEENDNCKNVPTNSTVNNQSYDGTVKRDNRKSYTIDIKENEVKTGLPQQKMKWVSETSASRIPSFNTPKSSPTRKRTKSDHLCDKQDLSKASHLTNSGTIRAAQSVHKSQTSSSIPSSVPNASLLPKIDNSAFSQPLEDEKTPSIKKKRILRMGYKESFRKELMASPRTQATTSHSIKDKQTISEIPHKQMVDILNVGIDENSYLCTGNVWSFNCPIEKEISNDFSQRLTSSEGNQDVDMEQRCPKSLSFFESLDEMEVKLVSPSLDTDSSVSTIRVHRTRDEGYSTMSSDQQQDSAADTTVSEQEESSTICIPPISSSRLVSDDSVMDFLDGSMTSSSDSGFGPLQQVVSNENCILHDDVSNSVGDDSSTENFNLNSGTTKASTFMRNYSHKNSSVVTELTLTTDSQQSRQNLDSNELCPSESSTKRYSGTYYSPNDTQTGTTSSVIPTTDHLSMVSNTHKLKQTNHSSSPSDNTVSVIGFLEDKTLDLDADFPCKNRIRVTGLATVETAEKATLTEPEEAMWREKALAHFIDESIWSLYSSESDTQIRFISAETAKDFSPEYPASSSQTHPVMKDADFLKDTDHISNNGTDNCSGHTAIDDAEISEETHLLEGVLGSQSTARNLERVASDSVLYLKEAVYQLENSMKPGLKSSRNFNMRNIPPIQKFSASNINIPHEPSLFDQQNFECPGIVLDLEGAAVQGNFLSPSSANRSHSSSVCSLPSSCQVISDEIDDIESHQSRKGSQDPDLSSASDGECDNLDHKHFVEEWIEKGNDFTCKVSQETLSPSKDDTFLSFLKTEGAKITSNKAALSSYSKPTGLSCNSESSLPSNAAISLLECVNSFVPSSPSLYPIIFTCENIDDDIEASSSQDEIGLDLQLLDAEVKEFNGDFYRLCDVGSTLSIDRTLPTFFEKIESSHASCSLDPHQPEIPTPTQISERSGKLQKTNFTKSTIIEKPPTFVRPSRPVTLSFYDVPNRISFHRFQKREFGTEQSVDQTEDNSSKTRNEYEHMPITAVADVHIPSPLKHLNQQLEKPSVKEKHQLSNSSISKSVASSVEGSYKLKLSLPVNQNLPRSSGDRSEVHFMTRLGSEKKDSKRPFVSDKGSRNVVSPKKNKEYKRQSWRKEKQAIRNASSVNKEGCGTAWIHLQTDANLSDPKAFASLLDSMAEKVSSSGSSSEDEERDFSIVPSNCHLYKICREKRKKLKASRADDLMIMSPRHRLTIMNRNSLYYRFGDREKEAIACFDFLEDIPTSSSEAGSTEIYKWLTPSSELNVLERNSATKERVNILSPRASSEVGTASLAVCQSRESSFSSRLKIPVLWNQPISHNMSSSTLNSLDYELLDHVSLSDSCAESYTSTPDSVDEIA